MPPLGTASTPLHLHTCLHLKDGPHESTPVCQNGSESCLPSKAKKSVHFAAKTEIRSVIGRKEFTDDEKRRIWMDYLDQQYNKRDICNTIYLIRSGLGESLSEDDHFCARGLEQFIGRGPEQKAKSKKSIGIALAMQRILRRTGAHNPEMIAKAYHKYTVQSRYVAHRKAVRDRDEVKAVNSSSSQQPKLPSEQGFL